MPVDPNLEQQAVLADTFRRAGAGVSRSELVSEVIASVGFVAAAAALFALRTPEPFSVWPGAMCVLVLALSTLVEFDTPLGFTVPTQLAFVPLLFAVPVAVVPPAVVVALAISRIPKLLTGEQPPSRMLTTCGNAWFAIGPVLVCELANVEPARAGALVLLAALAAQFLTDFLVSAARFAITRSATLVEQLQDTWVYGVDAALSGVGLVFAKAMQTTTPVAVVALVPLLGLFALFARERRKRLESLLELRDAYQGTALVLGGVVESDDVYTGQHSKGVVALALAVALRLGLTAEQQRNLEFGALLHDVGKIAIPKEIINKPGKLDPTEWTIIKTHTVEGQKMLDQVGGFMRDVGLIVRSHHERWDGSGYPDGLSGEAIPLESRIIACCDTWNAMRTDRSYRSALTLEAALTELVTNAGSQFDPEVVKALVPIVMAPEERRALEHAAQAHAA
jgi:putative nucleotidyltransferase with HDIG domain